MCYLNVICYVLIRCFQTSRNEMRFCSRLWWQYFFLLCMEITYFLSFCHWFNFGLAVSCAVLRFSVPCVKWGDVLAPFPKEHPVTFHECSSSGRKRHRPFDLWEGERKLALSSWSLTSRKDAQSWTVDLSISHVPRFLSHLSRSSCIRVLDARFADGCTEGWLTVCQQGGVPGVEELGNSLQGYLSWFNAEQSWVPLSSSLQS